MKSIRESMKELNRQVDADWEQAILSDPQVAEFITNHQLTQHEINISLSKFNQFLLERKKYETNDVTYYAKGYRPILVMNEGYADVTYQETKELIEAQKSQSIINNINLLNLPKSYKNIMFKDIYPTESKLAVLNILVDFVEQYPSANQKGLYLYGDMGIGKSYFMAALAHEMSIRGVLTTMVHFPSYVLDVKNAISIGAVKEMVDRVKTAPILILDDIGAEQATSWVRDEILQVILQYRMSEVLPTFFTSNYAFSDLEAKWANVKGNDETWQAKRVLERVRYLANEFHLEGANRRHDDK
ncbi:primosomal protein DnaI [Streptococcus sciuri]|uniref:Primosomal protein DnaI n=1 Tax=Streptococcus sciuri TaxID=2973939 RepID=A0ABT2F8P8_9STRE|nr:primosomal protein DnaI [Streptococcus sciuri]MCS4488853.1 primosomal protein DnaI [Streptococcus sciuri]